MNESTSLLSDIVVYMKYARYLPELKRRETWKEIVDRNMQMHIKKYPAFEQQIRDNYKFVFDKKVLPSMRALQFGGRPIELNPAREYNCFAPTTKFITSEGTKSFEDFSDGDAIKVLTHTGQWKLATVRKYGTQMVNKIIIHRGRTEVIEYATSNHRWLLRDGRETTNLQVGNQLMPAPSIFDEFDYDDALPFEKLYWCYGYVFGDGTITYGKTKGHSLVRLCGRDKEKFKYRFEEMGFKTSTCLSLKGDFYVYTGSYLKTSPDPKIDAPNLIRAFIAGYLDADGKKVNDKTMLSKFYGILASGQEHIDVIENLFGIAGIYITSKRNYSGRVTNFGERRTPTYDYNFSTNLANKTNVCFSVKEIQPFREMEVWCLDVEENHSFVLASGISTGNCSYAPIDHADVFSEAMFLLLSGCGFGYSVQKHHIRKLLPIRKPLAIKVLMKSYFNGGRDLDFDYRDIRPKGAALITSGGKAPGPQPLKDCIHNIRKILDAALQERGEGTQLKPIEAHDILCFIAEAVLSGGIRRSSMICFFSLDDYEMLECKFNHWDETNPQRRMANNSAVLLRHRISEEDFRNLWQKIEASGTGEPGVFFSNDQDMLGNPCLEVSLRANQFCNLVTINASIVKTQEDFNECARAASFIATLQAGYTDFHYLRDEWQETTEKEALIGVSITGIANTHFLSLNISEASKIVAKENEKTAKLLGIKKAARCCVIKPEGTSSLVLGTSSGVHAWYAPYYLRRIRVGKNEPIYGYLKNIIPDLIEDDYFKPEIQAVITVPVEAPDGAITRGESPLNLLKRVSKFHKDWIRPGHRIGNNTNNVSTTVEIKDNEWGEVGNWMWENRDSYNGIAVLPYDAGEYKQPPFEECNKEKFEEMMAKVKRIDLTDVKEEDDETSHQQEAACAGGSCEIQ